MKTDLILMAAGNSRRFGSNKLLYEWNGKKLYRYMLDALLEAAEELPQVRVRVVTQYEEILKMVEELAKREALGFLTGIYSPESVNGLSYTIRKALDFEAADPPDYFAFFTADTPELSAADIREFLEAFLASGHPVACVRCGETYGNPAVFSWKYAPLFQVLTGDQGGKKVLNQLLDDCFFYELPEGSRRDIDTPEDL